METEKKCARCGITIATMWDSNWYSYIRIKYCPACKVAAHREQQADSKRRTRRQAREAKKRARELLIQARAENEQLRQLRIENEQLRRRMQKTGADSRTAPPDGFSRKQLP